MCREKSRFFDFSVPSKIWDGLDDKRKSAKVKYFFIIGWKSAIRWFLYSIRLAWNTYTRNGFTYLFSLANYIFGEISLAKLWLNYRTRRIQILSPNVVWLNYRTRRIQILSPKVLIYNLLIRENWKLKTASNYQHYHQYHQSSQVRKSRQNIKK